MSIYGEGLLLGGLALHAEGKVKFSTSSGVTIVPGGQRTATIQVGGMTAICRVFATIQQPQSGVHIEGAEPGLESSTEPGRNDVYHI